MQLYLRPFYNILRQQNNFEWTTEHQTRFEEIKKLLTEQISNTIPDPNQPFYAMCDASNFGIGAALLQSHSGTNKMNLISAYSRLFTHNIFDRKYDHIISEALNDIQAYESFKEKFQLFSLTFQFLAPHERDLHCSHDIMLRTKQTHTYTYYRFIQNHFDLHTPSRQPHHRFQFLNSKYTSPFFLSFTYCIKDTNLHGILRNYDPVTQMYIFCPITKTFNTEESRPFLIPHIFIQPIEIPILEFIHNTKYNHKIYNLIQNTPYEFAVGTEELKTIKALQLLWPLLQTKNIIRILAKLLTTSDMIHDIFPHGFFSDD